MKEALKLLAERNDIPPVMMTDVMREIMSGEAEPAAIGGLLTGLAIKGESIAEVTAAAAVMREFARSIDASTIKGIMVDPVGTGGDGVGLFNVSTASAIIASAGGVCIAKHGNVAASSASGSADVLREAGVVLSLSPEQVVACIAETCFGFIFAQAYHQAMRHVVPVRRALGIRTMFNVLGPLSNPAGVSHQVLGVFSRDWLRPMAEVSRDLGSKRVLVVHAQNGLDEFSVTHDNEVVELKADGSITEYVLSPQKYGLQHDSHDALKVNSAAESLALIRAIFSGSGPAEGRDMLALNTAAVFYVAGLVEDFSQGIEKALEIMASGKALAQLERIATVSQRLAETKA